MAVSSLYLDLLASIPAFAGLQTAQLETLYGFCSLKVLSKGEAATVAGTPVDELGIIISGRAGELDQGAAAQEAGQGAAPEIGAFFGRRPSQATYVALCETVLLVLGRDDLMAALRTNPELLASCFSYLAAGEAELASAARKPRRLVICAAGGSGRLDPGVKAAMLSGLEALADIRLLGQGSFGSGMPGAITLNAPETAHWLQEQELEFDLTVVIPEGNDPGFARETVEEADEILFVASGGDAALSDLEKHALTLRGGKRCRLAIAMGDKVPLKRAGDWAEIRPYRSTQALDFASEAVVHNLCANILGGGNAIAATSRGVYAAAILGALQAFEAKGQPAVCLAGAGSAILPAGLLASGASLAQAEAIFTELSNPALWKRAARVDAGLFDPAPVDSFLASALAGCEIATAERCFAAVSHSLSTGEPELHREGRLQRAIRAGLAPSGILPPLILDDGTILISGEHEIEALLAALKTLSASPVSFIYPNVPPLGASVTPYRHLSEGGAFRLTPFQSQSALDRRVRLETVLGTLGGRAHPLTKNVRFYAVPIPEGIMPMDWAEWASLRDLAVEWTSAELERLDAAGDEGPTL